ncbi:MAG TPA: hypothetical protein VML50_07900 [Anaeromyxobacter sp.]|nr:hypothetical protein [Anaeromyxobacter sp.]
MPSPLRGLALALLLAGSARAGEPVPAPQATVAPAAGGPAHAPPAEAHPAGEWREYVLAEAGFAARFPAAPSHDVTEQGPLTLLTYGVEVGAGGGYGVVCMRFKGLPGDLPLETLDKMRDGMAAQYGGKLASDRKTTAGGLPARDLTVEAEGELVTARIVLGKDRVFQMTAIAKGAALPPAEVRAFLDSFRPL